MFQLNPSLYVHCCTLMDLSERRELPRVGLRRIANEVRKLSHFPAHGPPVGSCKRNMLSSKQTPTVRTIRRSKVFEAVCKTSTWANNEYICEYRVHEYI